MSGGVLVVSFESVASGRGERRRLGHRRRIAWARLGIVRRHHDVPERLHGLLPALGLGEKPVRAGLGEAEVRDVDVRRVRLGAARNADALELRRRLEERGASSARATQTRAVGSSDTCSLAVDDEERHANVARLVVRRSRDDRDVVPRRAPELLERLAASGNA